MILRSGLAPPAGHVWSFGALVAVVVGACLSSHTIRSNGLTLLQRCGCIPSYIYRMLRRVASSIGDLEAAHPVTIRLPMGFSVSLHKQPAKQVVVPADENKAEYITGDDKISQHISKAIPSPDVQAAPPAHVQPPLPPPPPPLPPPPPPLPPAIPPPPVPPLPGSSSTRKVVRRASSLKAFHWEKIAPPASGEDTIWNPAPGSVELCNFSALQLEVSLHFEKEEFRRPPTPARRGEDAAKLVTFLDSHRAQNLGILMRRIASRALDTRQLCDALWSMDMEVLHGDLLDTLLQAAPTDRELAAIPRRADDISLRKQERFLVRLASVSMCRDRLILLRSWEILPHRLRELRTRIDRVRESVDAICKSDTLRRALHITLRIGNFLNSGQRQGEAAAFTLESLNRLSTTKSVVDKHKTLLHLLHDHASLSSLVEEFFCLRSTKHIEADELQADIDDVRQLLQPSMAASCDSDNPCGVDDGYPNFVAQFHLRFTPRVERLNTAYDELRAASCQMKAFLGLPDHQNPSWTAVFRSLAEFTDLVAKLTK